MSGSPLAVSFVRRGSRLPLGLPWSRLAVFQHLSLDVVAGVVCGGAFAVAMTGATLPVAWWIVLPLATWVVYSADRIFDARRPAVRSQERHRWYRRHHRRLAVATAILGCAGLVGGLAGLPSGLRAGGLAIVAACAIHLRLAQLPRTALKEFSAAAIYVAGIWFGPLLLAPRWEAGMWIGATLHGIAAAANLVAFSLFESRPDERDGQPSIVRSHGAGAARGVLRALTAIGVAGVPVLALGSPATGPAVPAVLLTLILLPSVMVRYAALFAPRQRYRIAGDLAFVLLWFAA